MKPNQLRQPAEESETRHCGSDVLPVDTTDRSTDTSDWTKVDEIAYDPTQE